MRLRFFRLLALIPALFAAGALAAKPVATPSAAANPASPAPAEARNGALPPAAARYEAAMTALLDAAVAAIPDKAAREAAESAAARWRRDALPTLTDDALFQASLGPLWASLGLPAASATGPASDVTRVWALREAKATEDSRHWGFTVTPRGKRWFVSQVLADGPAATAGLKRGDEVVTIDEQPFTPADLFPANATVAARIAWRRSPGGALTTRTVTLPKRGWWAQAATDALRGESVTRLGDRRVGYARLLMADGDAWHVRLTSMARRMEERADIWILDLRGGHDGWVEGLAKPFFAQETGGKKTPAVYTKPLLVLVDGATAGSREWLAAFLQAKKRALLVGQGTAGLLAPMVASEPVPGWRLRLPRERLSTEERKDAFSPVTPDVAVQDAVSYAEGMDFTLEEARALAQKLDAEVVPPAK